MRGARHPLHPETRRALASARKSIVLLNRRGWSNFLSCRSCGKTWECPNCEVALVLHRAENAIACHHCGHRERVPERCDACGSLSVARHGAGTERVEHELREGLDVPIFRLDADTAGAKDAVPELLARFRAAPEGLLLGTQMVAKGHDFPDVTLGVVLDADCDAALPRLPRRGAHVRADRAARRPRRARASAAGACSCRRRAPGGGGDRRRRPPRRRRLPGRRARAPARARLPAVRRPDPGRLLQRGRTRRRPARPRAPSRPPSTASRAPRCSGPRRCSACAAASASSSSSRRRARAEAVRATGAAVEAAARDRAHRDVAFSVDVDPQ